MGLANRSKLSISGLGHLIGLFMSSAAPLVETTQDRLRRELSQSSQAEARESLLREECARLRADNRALKRAEARHQSPPSAALYRAAHALPRRKT